MIITADAFLRLSRAELTGPFLAEMKPCESDEPIHDLVILTLVERDLRQDRRLVAYAKF
jgi:hypothetical protein